jgi:hypothetical protein
VRTLVLSLLGTPSVVGGMLAARLSKERARTGITIPMHAGAQRFFERSSDTAARSGNP